MPQPTADRRDRLKPTQSSVATDDATPRWSEQSFELCGRPAQIETYNSRTVRVSAASYGTNSNLYVEQGDLIEVQAAGSWTIWAGETEPFSPADWRLLAPCTSARKAHWWHELAMRTNKRRFALGKVAAFGPTNRGLFFCQ